MNQTPSKSHPTPQARSAIPAILIGSLVILLLSCVCLVALGATLLIVSSRESSFGLSPAIYQATSTPLVIRPDSAPSATLSTTPVQSNKPDFEIREDLPANQSPSATPQPVLSVPDDTLRVLLEEPIPTNDPIELAKRLEGKGDIPPTLPPPAAPLTAGMKKNFWVTNSDTNKNFQVTATLRQATEHAYFWIEDGVRFNQSDLEFVSQTFEEKIYPTNRSFFGSEWTPGVDSDPHLYILFARGLGTSIAGYYSSGDQYPPQANEFSNGHEMFLLSADILDLGDEYTLTVLAHEFQHMIHWNTDRNEESWLNEGFSELASFINGYGVGYHDYSYIDDPDIQLTDWPEGSRAPHYGAAFLFVNYFLNRFGSEITQKVIASPLNGLASIDQVMAEMNIRESGLHSAGSDELIQADDIFADWVLASYILDDQVEDGRYTYTNYPGAPQAGATETITKCPTGIQTRDVSQYGVDYIDITCQGEFTLSFEGSIQVPVIPPDPISGKHFFWSNRGDESDMTLTRFFDFTSHNGPLTLNYWTWFDLEKDYDYLYLEVSTDGGKTWEIMITPSGTAEDPSGNNFGWGYNGASGNSTSKGPENARWIQESIDLSRFAGQEIWIRFEYITDAAVNGNGLVLDDLSIPEIGYFTDFEQDDGGWIAEGFVRIQNILPQTYRLSIIRFGPEITVEKYSLANENAIDIPLSISNGTRKVVLVVSGTTPITRQKTAYRFQIDE
jgi:immune inhibitor A